MRLYYEVARRSLRRQMTYSAANWAGAATNIFFGCLRSFVFVALFEARAEVQGYQLDDALAYVWLTQAILMFSQIWGWWEISNSIRTGAVATDLARPFDYYLYWLSQDIGRALYFLLLRSVPIYAAGALLFGVGLPSEPLIWLAFAISLVGAELVSFSFRFLLNLSSFWLLDHRGIAILASVAASFFSGLLVPNALFPDWLRAISDWLPFQSILYVPSRVFLGQLGGAALAGALLQQLAWFVGLTVAGRAVLALATRRLVVQGG